MSREDVRKALHELKQMYEEGLLEEAEYQAERQQLMARWRSLTPGAEQTSQAAASTPAPGAWGAGDRVGHGAADPFVTGGGPPAAAQPSPAQLSAESGRLLMGRYRLQRLLGEGGMGQVYEAIDTMMNEVCALKLIRQELAQDAGVRQRFVNELSLTRRLSHPGVVRTHSLQQDPRSEEFFFTMEYLQGETLEEMLRERHGQVPPLALKDTLQIIAGLAEILDYAHSQGVIHRDLKPANVMCLADGGFKLMDFGIAKALSGTHATKYTGFLGTVYYVAPEQLRGREDVTPAADIYSLGVMLYELLTGEVPMGAVEPPSALVPGLPKGVDGVVMRAMAARAAQRFGKATELSTALHEACMKKSSPTKREEPTKTQAPKPATPDIHLPAKSEPWKQGTAPGEVREVKELPDAHVVWCPPGNFLMGSPDSDEESYGGGKPQHKVSLSRGFWLWQTPVTQAQFEKSMGYNPSRFGDDGRLPVETVSWHEAAAFCNALSRTQGLPEVYEERGRGQDIECELKAEYASHKGQDYYRAQGWRLPTETEWEYAARSGTSGSRYGKLDQIAWYYRKVGDQTHPVGQKQPNDWGLYDMLGNVNEWAYDWYGRYSSAAVSDPVGPSSGSGRVFRGGGWNESAESARAALRCYHSPGVRGHNLGFRPVKGGL